MTAEILQRKQDYTFRKGGAIGEFSDRFIPLNTGLEAPLRLLKQSFEQAIAEKNRARQLLEGEQQTHHQLQQERIRLEDLLAQKRAREDRKAPVRLGWVGAGRVALAGLKIAGSGVGLTAAEIVAQDMANRAPVVEAASCLHRMRVVNATDRALTVQLLDNSGDKTPLDTEQVSLGSRVLLERLGESEITIGGQPGFRDVLRVEGQGLIAEEVFEAPCTQTREKTIRLEATSTTTGGTTTRSITTTSPDGRASATTNLTVNISDGRGDRDDRDTVIPNIGALTDPFVRARDEAIRLRDEAQRQLDDLRREVNGLRDTVSDLRRQLDEANRKLTTEQDAKKVAEEARKTAENQRDQAIRELQQQRTLQEIRSGRFWEDPWFWGTLFFGLTTAGLGIAALTADRGRRRVIVDLNTRNQDVANRDAQITALNGQITVLTQERDTARTDFQTANNAVTRLTGENTRLTTDNQTLTTDNQRVNTENQRLNGEVQRFTAENQTLNNDLVAARQHVQQLTADLGAQNQEVQALRADLQATNQNLANTTGERNTFQGQIADLNRQITELTEQLNRANADLAKRPARGRGNRAEVTELRRQLAAERAEKATIEAERARLAQQEADNAQEIARLRTLVAEPRPKTAVLREIINRLRT